MYDLSKSDSIPTHYFVLPSGKVRDATFVSEGGNTHVIIISSQGYIYTEILNKEASAEPFYMMNVLPVEHSTMEEASGMINGGGCSVYYSKTLKLLFFSYTKGKYGLGFFFKIITWAML